jgi:AraC family transcriptional activator of pobA
MPDLIELQSFYHTIHKELQPVQYDIGHFNIFRIEDLELPQQKPLSYNRRDFFKISLVKGRSNIHYADQSMDIDGDVLVFTNPLIPYSWERISSEHTGYICVFTEAFFHHSEDLNSFFVFQHASSAIIPLDGNDAAVFYLLFEKMYAELQGAYSRKYELIRHMLMEVIHSAQKIHPLQGSPAVDSNASKRIYTLFAELLERQFPIETSNQCIKLKTPSQYAAQLNIHVNHLNKVLKETTGQTTYRLINERLLQEAKILLKSTAWTVNEIAWSLGFEEAHHFSAFFKHRQQLTPTAFRNHHMD